MKKMTIILLCLLLLPNILLADVYFATVEGMQVTVLNINLKKAGSNPIGASSPNQSIDLTEGVSSSIGTISIEEADQTANELSFDFSNIEIPLKAWATDGINYYFTTAAGIGQSTSANSADWTEYDYMNVPRISPDRTDGRVVVQSYFPSSVFIGQGDSFTVTGNVDLSFTCLYWDGTTNNLPSNSPFAYYNSLYPTGTPAFAVVVPDVVLAMNTQLFKETYAFATDAADLSPLNVNNCRIISFFYDNNGNIYDGAGKYLAGYNAGGSTWQRLKAVTKNADDSYNLTFARNYSESQGQYIFDVPASNTFTRLNVNEDSGSSYITVADPSSSNATDNYFYKRIE